MFSQAGSMLMYQGPMYISTGLEVMQQSTHMVEELLDYVIQGMENAGDRAEMYRILRKNTDDLNYAVVFKESDNMAFRKRMDEEGIPYVGGLQKATIERYNSTGDKEQVEGYVYFYPAAKEHTVEAIRDSIIDKEAIENSIKLKDRSVAEARLISAHAKDMGINVEISESGRNTYNIIYNRNDAVRMRYIEALTSVELSGTDGELIREGLEYEENYDLMLEERIFDYNLAEPFYIADLEGNVMTVDRNSVTYSGDKGEMSFTKTDETRAGICGLYMSMTGETMLDKNEYEKYHKGDCKERRRLLSDIHVQRGLPVITKEAFAAFNLKENNITEYVQRIDSRVDTSVEVSMAGFTAMQQIASHMESMTVSEPEPVGVRIEEEGRSRFRDMEDNDRVAVPDNIKGIEEMILNDHTSLESIQQYLKQELEKNGGLDHMRKEALEEMPDMQMQSLEDIIGKE